ncbi:MAG: hypothetical protein JWO48_792 [Bryobacterales bacterium]|nr:hypothetical protein [Bryobacterales bacterium]
MKRYLTVLFVGAALAGSVPARADEHHSDSHTKRYYDATARDYHEWNQNENQVYHQYVTENHKRDREFARTNRTERKDYFKWRHEHPDQDRH